MTARFTELEFQDQMLALKDGLEEDALWDKISRLPRELKTIIGNYSTRVHTQKQWVRHQFFRKWTVENFDRVLGLISKWTKAKILWLMTKCNYFNYTCMVLNKTKLIEHMRSRMVNGCEQHFNGRWLYCIFHARRIWQQLHVIDYVDKTLKTRKSLALKRSKAEKRQREEENRIE